MSETRTNSGVAEIFDLAWQDTETAVIALHGLDNGQLDYVAGICRIVAAEAKRVKRERALSTGTLSKRPTED